MIPLSDPTAAGGEIQIVVLQVGHELYGAPIRDVREVVPAESYRITPIPRIPRYIRGVTNLRGRVIPVMDLRMRLGLKPGPLTRKTRIAVVETEASGTVGMIVDGVSEVVRLPVRAIEPPPEDRTDGSPVFVQGVARLGDRLVALLDLGRVLTREDRRPAIEGGRHGAAV